MKRYSLAIKYNEVADLLSIAEIVAYKHESGEYTLASDTLRLMDALKLARQHIFAVNGATIVFSHIQEVIEDIEGKNNNE